MRRLAVNLLLIGNAVASLGQDAEFPGINLEVPPIFSPSTVRAKGIRRVEALYSFKYDLQVIRNSNRKEILEFDANGLVWRTMEINSRPEFSDTSFREIYRNPDGSISMTVVKEGGYFTVTREEKGLSGSLIISSYLIPTRLKWNDHINPRYRVWKDSVDIAKGNRSFYNQYGLIYKKQVERTDPDRGEKELSEYGMNGKIVRKYVYEYDSGNTLKRVEEISYADYFFSWFTAYESDAHGKLLKETYFKNGHKEYERRISYREDGLPELDISRNEVQKMITIIKYVYPR